MAHRLRNTLGACRGGAAAKRLGLDAEHGDGMQDKARLAYDELNRKSLLRMLL
jgi:hypothetical protein